MSLPTIGKQQNPGEAVTEVADREIRRLCSELASTYCSFEEPNHSVELHQAFDARLHHAVKASAHDAINAAHGDLARLRERGVDEGDLPERLKEPAP